MRFPEPEHGVRRGYRRRRTIRLIEHDYRTLPADVVRADGTLDLYGDVQRRFEITYRRPHRRLAIRSGGWIGHIPINDHYALDIEARVPVNNLERVLARSGDPRIERLAKYYHRYGHTDETPKALYDVLADQFLTALDAVWRGGLAKAYVREDRTSCAPFGRVYPFLSERLTQQVGGPEARFVAFVRTRDCPPNRVLCTAARRLVALYTTWEGRAAQTGRLRQLREARRRLEAIAGPASRNELSARAVQHEIRHIPAFRQGYVWALELAQMIVDGYGVRIGDEGDGRATLPALLVNMADTFEKYVRGVLRKGLTRGEAILVKDGNASGVDGGRRDFFSEFHGIGEVPPATPDIVVCARDRILAVIDVKYKPARATPDRADLNQVVSYGVAYACQNVVIVYPNVPRDGFEMLQLGRVGPIRVYRGSLNLGAADLDVEEERFWRSVAERVLTEQ